MESSTPLPGPLETGTTSALVEADNNHQASLGEAPTAGEAPNASRYVSCLQPLPHLSVNR